MTNQDYANLVEENISCINLCIIGKEVNAGQFYVHTDFGTPAAWTFCTYLEHITFLEKINNLHESNDSSKILNGEILNQWRLANDLIKTEFVSYDGNQTHILNIKNQASGLACFILFPIFEDVVRQISEYWDEEGIMSEDAPESLVFKGRKGDIRKYKKDSQISSLHDKLLIMESTLPDVIKKYIKDLAVAMQRQPIRGLELELPTFYRQLEIERNNMLHGRKYSGNVALLISLLISLFYLTIEKNHTI